ncbi:hypothetical protein C8Q77DRAFT_1086018 [Trametes polyzona]|nr:hypothetical protein C8Q77DRAFT_1086018 [Trametes polyzona]
MAGTILGQSLEMARILQLASFDILGWARTIRLPKLIPSEAAPATVEGMSDGTTRLIAALASVELPSLPPAWIVALSLASLQAASLAAIVRIPSKLSGPPQAKPWFRDDVLYEIFSYLDPPDAAHAGLVCTHWYRNATQAMYRSVTLHASSRASHVLARMLRDREDLRRRVRHLTVLHCTPFPQDELYEWVALLPARALATCRLLVVCEWTWALELELAYETAGSTERVAFGWTREEDVRAALDNGSVGSRSGVMVPCWRMGLRAGEDRCMSVARSALARELSFPETARAFYKLFDMDKSPRVQRKWDILLDEDDKELMRERVEALLPALDDIFPLMEVMTITFAYHPQPGDDTDDAGAGQARDAAPSEPAPLAVLRRLHYEEFARCACSASEKIPLDARLAGLVAVAHTSDVARKVLDRAWRVREGNPARLRMVCIGLAHIDVDWSLLALPCATCGLSPLCFFYLPPLV